MTLGEKIKSWIDRFLRKLSSIYKNYELETEEGKIVSEMKDAIEEIQSLFADALSDASDNFANADVKTQKNTTNDGDVKLQAREDFGQQLNDWVKGQGKAFGKYNGKYFDLGTTSNVLIKHGAPNAELIMYEDCLVKITGGKHAISLDELSKLPIELDNPVLLFSGSVPNSFVALTELVDVHGNDVIAIVHIDKRYGRSVINKIASVYSKTDQYDNNKIISYVKNQIEQGNLIDASIKKAPTWFTSRGLQLPKLVQTTIDANSNNKVPQKEPVVNTYSMQQSKKIQKSFLIEILQEPLTKEKNLITMNFKRMLCSGHTVQPQKQETQRCSM